MTTDPLDDGERPHAWKWAWASSWILGVIGSIAGGLFSWAVLTAPRAVNDPDYKVNPGDPLLVIGSEGGVLHNDEDPDHFTARSSLEAVVHEGPRRGTLDLRPDGSFTYRPPSGFVGEVVFTYKAVDKDWIIYKYSNSATVRIDVLPTPVTIWRGRPQPDRYSAERGEELGVEARAGVVSNDGDGADTCRAELMSDVAHGRLRLGGGGRLRLQAHVGVRGRGRVYLPTAGGGRMGQRGDAGPDRSRRSRSGPVRRRRGGLQGHQGDCRPVQGG